MDEKGEKVLNLGFCLLTFVSIHDSLRSNLPQINFLTTADKFIFSFMTFSIFPGSFVLSFFWEEEEREQAADDIDIILRYINWAYFIFSMIYFIVKFII